MNQFREKGWGIPLKEPDPNIQVGARLFHLNTTIEPWQFYDILSAMRCVRIGANDPKYRDIGTFFAWSTATMSLDVCSVTGR